MSQTAELNIEQEVRRHEEEQRALQVKSDLEVLRRREEDYESGRTHMLSSGEFWSNIRKAGF
ncbi:MAG: hypothetical protein FWF11_04735 [Coriobacteriia bacterium]|nr:hypothetical protein [Coriobacteriia bacterium]